MRVLALYLANLRVAARYLVVLLLAAAAFAALVFASLPQSLFKSGELPTVSLALVYGNEDTLVRNLQTEVVQVEVVESLTVCSAAEAERMLASGEVDAVVTLPLNTFDALVSGGNATITVAANDPLVGSVVYAVCERAVETLDSIQNYTLVYATKAQEHIAGTEAQSQAVRLFALQLLGDTLDRLSSVEVRASASPYYVQVLTLLLFFVVSLAALFAAVVLARQYSQGYVRHLTQRGVSFMPLYTAQLLLCCTLALVLSTLLGIMLRLVDDSFDVVALAASGVMLALVVGPLFALMSGVAVGRGNAATRTLLGCCALMFFMLFAGGGFYPSFLMETSLRLFNPTWLSNLLATWSLGGGLDVRYVALFTVPLSLSLGGCYLEWRMSR
ncbi:MAG: ABC transporter permease [Coriobacteriales bacterium]|nr:ABC transporter permease [Coriobacteriales bacterium]